MPWGVESLLFFLSDTFSQTSSTSNQPTWRIWRRWSQRLSSTPTTVTCLSTAAAKAPCASVTWEKQHCATNTPNVSKPAESWDGDKHVLLFSLPQKVKMLDVFFVLTFELQVRESKFNFCAFFTEWAALPALLQDDTVSLSSTTFSQTEIFEQLSNESCYRHSQFTFMVMGEISLIDGLTWNWRHTFIRSRSLDKLWSLLAGNEKENQLAGTCIGDFIRHRG